MQVTSQVPEARADPYDSQQGSGRCNKSWVCFPRGGGICCFKHTQYVGDCLLEWETSQGQSKHKETDNKTRKNRYVQPGGQEAPGFPCPSTPALWVHAASVRPASTVAQGRQIHHQVTALNGNGQVDILNKCHPNRQDRPEQTIPWAENKPQKQTDDVLPPNESQISGVEME